MVGMKLAPEPDDDWVDLNRVDVLRSMPERCSHVRPDPAPSTRTFSKVSPNTM